MKIVWKTASAVVALALISCGGGGNAALSKNFNYGSPAAPTASEQSAATSAQSTVSSTSTFGTSPDSTKATAITSLADDLAASALGGTAIGMVPNMTPVAADPRFQHAVSRSVTAACTVVTANSVTFNNCQDSESGYTFTLNGTISATTDTVTWEINGTFAGTNQGISLSLALHQKGTLTVTSTTVKGNATSELSGSVSGNGQSVSFGLDTAAVLDLTYNANCVTSGSIEVKRVWSDKPSGASGPDFADVAVKLTWTGCNTVQVQHST
jgi:hypothetical protein